MLIANAFIVTIDRSMYYKHRTRDTGRAVLLYNSVAFCIIGGILLYGIVGRVCNGMYGMGLHV